MQFSPSLRDRVGPAVSACPSGSGPRPKVKVGGRYPIGPATLVVDDIELIPFHAITAADIRRAGEHDREALPSPGRPCRSD